MPPVRSYGKKKQPNASKGAEQKSYGGPSQSGRFFKHTANKNAKRTSDTQQEVVAQLSHPFHLLAATATVWRGGARNRSRWPRPAREVCLVKDTRSGPGFSKGRSKHAHRVSYHVPRDPPFVQLVLVTNYCAVQPPPKSQQTTANRQQTHGKHTANTRQTHSEHTPDRAHGPRPQSYGKPSQSGCFFKQTANATAERTENTPRGGCGYVPTILYNTEPGVRNSGEKKLDEMRNQTRQPAPV
jgi:hypothetical protein